MHSFIATFTLKKADKHSFIKYINFDKLSLNLNLFFDFWANTITTPMHKQLRLLVITLFVLCRYFYTHLYKALFMLYFWFLQFATAR